MEVHLVRKIRPVSISVFLRLLISGIDKNKSMSSVRLQPENQFWAAFLTFAFYPSERALEQLSVYGKFLKAQQNSRCSIFTFRAHTQHRGKIILDMIHEFRGSQRREKTLSADSRCVLRFRFVCIRCCVSNLITKPGGIFFSFCQIYCTMCSRCDFLRFRAFW